jgi:hypothetical protein
MSEEINSLVQEIAKMSNVYGFCARHQVKMQEDNFSRLILETYQAMQDGKVKPDPGLKDKLAAYMKKNA